MTVTTATRYEIDVESGGRLEMHWFEGMSQAFMSDHPTSPATLDAIEKIAEFVHRETR